MGETKEHVNITFMYEHSREQAADLRIPRNITVYRLIRELNQIFGKQQEVPKYQLKVKNKGLLLDEEKKLKDYPVTDGDIIEVLGE
ncbi:EsaB/YukD family protein [Enterococcus faecalis]